MKPTIVIEFDKEVTQQEKENFIAGLIKGACKVNFTPPWEYHIRSLTTSEQWALENAPKEKP